MTGFYEGLEMMKPKNHKKARAYYEQKEGNKMHKNLKVSSELHAEIKKEAQSNGMFIDAFLRKALDDHKKQKMLRELRGL